MRQCSICFCCGYRLIQQGLLFLFPHYYHNRHGGWYISLFLLGTWQMHEHTLFYCPDIFCPLILYAMTLVFNIMYIKISCIYIGTHTEALRDNVVFLTMYQLVFIIWDFWLSIALVVKLLTYTLLDYFLCCIHLHFFFHRFIFYSNEGL